MRALIAKLIEIKRNRKSHEERGIHMDFGGRQLIPIRVKVKENKNLFLR
jgi:hypothetical protein